MSWQCEEIGRVAHMCIAKAPLYSKGTLLVQEERESEGARTKQPLPVPLVLLLLLLLSLVLVLLVLLNVPWTSLGRPWDVPWVALGLPLIAFGFPLDVPWTSDVCPRTSQHIALQNYQVFVVNVW